MTTTKMFAIAIALIAAILGATPALCADERPRPISPRELFSEVPGAENKRPLSPKDIPGADAWDVPGIGDETDRQTETILTLPSPKNFPLAPWRCIAGVGYVVDYHVDRRERVNVLREDAAMFPRPRIEYLETENELYVLISGDRTKGFRLVESPLAITRFQTPRQDIMPYLDNEGSLIYSSSRGVSVSGYFSGSGLSGFVNIGIFLPDWEYRICWEEAERGECKRQAEMSKDARSVLETLEQIRRCRPDAFLSYWRKPAPDKIVLIIDGREIWRGDYRQIPD